MKIENIPDADEIKTNILVLPKTIINFKKAGILMISKSFITGGGYITAEHKFKDPFKFLNFAKHIFATNKIPPVKDLDDDAYYDRWLPLPCDNQVDKKEQDKFLIDELATEAEMSGLLNYALEGLRRLLEIGSFSYKKESSEIKRIMERHGNPLSLFAQDWLKREDGNRISKSLMFEIYTLFCEKEEKSRLSKEQLGRQLPKFVQYILAKNDSKERYWENVGINKLHIDCDTYDTIQNIISNYLESSKSSKNKVLQLSNMLSGKVSKVSEESSNKNDINDTSIQKGTTLELPPLPNFTKQELEASDPECQTYVKQNKGVE